MQLLFLGSFWEQNESKQADISPPTVNVILKVNSFESQTQTTKNGVTFWNCANLHCVEPFGSILCIYNMLCDFTSFADRNAACSRNKSMLVSSNVDKMATLFFAATKQHRPPQQKVQNQVSRKNIQ